MDSCKHTSLVLLTGQKNRVRCRHCHLTIEKNELDDGYCPECFETRDEKRYEFEEVKASGTEGANYRCEECGVIIHCE